ncbi:peptide chain release factor N(5)-glutamine methyltransferase [Acidicapsa dinghuensis]|uniref:Release factor glutamine methyltransferase n=1 Tax=Acidicapsa dinghuensis TaxID=2218256 RepID=A0ABW1EAI1_9BACT|nr:peptide chain release factor N(5)-glutamine methyltransferase [Acidicapsa dinghuensis]
MKVRELLARAEERLRSGPHPDRARLDAETLLLHAFRAKKTDRNRAWLLTHADDEADVETQVAFEAFMSRRIAGEPIQYILGECEFFGLPFTVTRDVLIPRPETEHLVEKVIRIAQSLPQQDPLHIADIGTGSGAIAVAAAHTLPQARILATDLSPNALSAARQNAERNNVADRIELVEGDLLSPLAGHRFSIIASNPPYVPMADCDTLSKEVRDYEPHLALFAGGDGLDVYRRLIPNAREHLVPGGWLLMEIGYGQQEAIAKLFQSNGYLKIQFIPDYQLIPRVAVAQK